MSLWRSELSKRDKESLESTLWIVEADLNRLLRLKTYLENRILFLDAERAKEVPAPAPCDWGTETGATSSGTDSPRSPDDATTGVSALASGSV